MWSLLTYKQYILQSQMATPMFIHYWIDCNYINSKKKMCGNFNVISRINAKNT